PGIERIRFLQWRLRANRLDDRHSQRDYHGQDYWSPQSRHGRHISLCDPTREPIVLWAPKMAVARALLVQLPVGSDCSASCPSGLNHEPPTIRYASSNPLAMNW